MSAGYGETKARRVDYAIVHKSLVSEIVHDMYADIMHLLSIMK